MGNGKAQPPRDATALLAEFRETGREAAFEEIVRRYAGMVFAVCLRATRSAHDAEDATQAAFLALAVQCKTGQTVTRVGPWLQKVARRAALDVRRARKRRDTHEQRHGEAVARSNGSATGTNGAARAGADDIDLEMLNRVLAEELARLPAKYRLPLISLYFGGMSRDEIAKELGCTIGTLGVRIHRARQMLARRLGERGVASPGRLLAGAVLANAIAATVGASMMSRTAEAAVRIATGTDPAAVAANVMALLKSTTAAATIAAKLKAPAAVVILAVATATAAGGATTARGLDLAPVLRKIVRTLRSSLQPPSFRGPSLRPVSRVPASQAGALPAPTGAAPAVASAAPAGRALPPVTTTSAAATPGAQAAGPARVVTPGRSAPPPPPTVSSSAGVAAAATGRPTAPPPPERAGGVPLAGVHPAPAWAPRPSPGRRANAPNLPLPSTSGADHVGHGDFTVGGSGGWLAQSLLGPPAPPVNAVPVPGPALTVAADPGTVGTYTLASGTFFAAAQDVGRFGTGHFVHSGGVNHATQMRLGSGAGGTGVYDLAGRGTLVLNPVPAGTQAVSGIQVGGAGAGVLNLGNATTSGTIYQPHPGGLPGAARGLPPGPPPAAAVAAAADFAVVDDAFSTFVVRGDPAGSGQVQGWGSVIGSGSSLVQNGQVIADGYGVDRALIFVGYPAVTNTIENPAAGGTNGWFACDGGRLILPKIPAARGTGTYTWGESPDDPTIDLVNSVRVTLRDARHADNIDVSLLDPGRGDVPALPGGHTFVGVWALDTGMTMPAGVDLTVRYDDGLAASLGLDESALKLWQYDAAGGGGWLRMDGDPTFARDTAQHLLSAHAAGSPTFFAVSAPEPGAAVPLLFGAAAALLRRRRRRETPDPRCRAECHGCGGPFPSTPRLERRNGPDRGVSSEFRLG